MNRNYLKSLIVKNKWQINGNYLKSLINLILLRNRVAHKLTNKAKEYNKNMKQMSYAQALTNCIHAYVIYSK